MSTNLPAGQAAPQATAAVAFDFSKHQPHAAFAGLDPASESLADGIGSSYGIIGYKGKTWSLRYRGETHLFVRTDDGTPMSYIDVVVLRQGHAKSKSYYKDGYDEGASAGKAPTCSSIDSVRPDPGVPEPQSETCGLCPKNVWRTDENGRKGRDCTDYKRLAVTLLPKQTAALLGQALLEPVFLRVPPASLNDLAQMGEQMASQGWHYSTFILRISFDPALSHPKFVFRPIQPLTDKEAGIILKMREDPIALRITGEDGTVQSLPAPTPAPTTGPAPTPKPVAPKVVAPAAPPAAPPTPKPVQKPVPKPTPKPVPKPVPKPTPPPPPSVVAAQEPVDTGFGLGDGTVTEAEVIEETPPEQAAETVAEAVPEETAEAVTEETAAEQQEAVVSEDGSDAGLDADIAALLNSK